MNDNRRAVIKGSLRAALSIPQREQFDASSQALTQVIPRARVLFESYEPNAIPDYEALKFYCLNHLTSILQQKFHPDERLPDWALEVVEAYVAEVVAQSMRMYTYLLAITTRENRHQYAYSAAFKKMHLKTFGDFSEPLSLFHNEKIKGKGEGQAVSTLFNFPPDVPFGTYVRHLTVSFNSGSWSTGYGGKAWGTVSKCFEDCVFGRTSLEMMVDLGYALAHNNGPIFNKGMMYQTYSGNFLNLLDLQRSGFIPTSVLLAGNAHVSVKQYVNQKTFGKLNKQCQRVQAELGGIPTYVDYYKVAAFGVSGNYDYEKKAQVAAHGPPTELFKKPVPEVAHEEDSEIEDSEVEPVYKPPLSAHPVILYPGVTVYSHDDYRKVTTENTKGKVSNG